MKIEIDLRVIFIILLFYINSQIEIYFLFVFFIILHELSHIIVRKNF